MNVAFGNDFGKEITKVIQEIVPGLVALRRDLHAFPEIGFELHQTSKRLSDGIRAIGLSPRENIGRIGIFADIVGMLPGPCTLLRADMDALPIEEKTGLPYASTIPGVMHACGHDIHSAALLGAATALMQRREELAGTVRIVFQPAEETIESGAQAMIADGVLDGVDMALGFHNWPQLPAGTVQFVQGASFASCDTFTVELHGKSGHAAAPFEADDPIIGAASIIMQLQNIVFRKVRPSDPVLLNVTTINGGSSENIIPDTCSFSGTVRCHSFEARELAERLLRSTCEHGARTFGLSAEVSFERGMPPVLNDSNLVSFGCEVLSDQFKTSVLALPQSIFISEDFALFAERVPAVHMLIGSGQEGRSDRLHSSNYQPDEKATIKTAAISLARMAIEMNSRALRDVSAKKNLGR